MLQTGKETIKSASMIGGFKPGVFLVGLWKHECERVFCDKLTDEKDKDWFLKNLSLLTADHFSPETQEKLETPIYFCDFLRDDKLNEDGEIEELSPKIYEAIPHFDKLKEKVNEYMAR
jgi:dynein heavy chain